jgi:hypothetical protein
MVNRVFDRIPEFDEQSRNYPVRALLAAAQPVTRFWDIDVWLDQGSEGACVGFAWGHDIAAEPAVGPVDNGYARFIYHEARFIDEWVGEDYEGTSVLAGAKVMTKLGWISEYRWAFSTDDVLATLGSLGPVILGVNWYSDMFDTDANGYVHVSGQLLGGHAILITGVDFENSRVQLHNSWGQSWGQNGKAWLSFSDLDRLLHEQGEGCIPLVRNQVVIDPIDPIEPVDPIEPEPEPEPAGDNWFTRFINWLWSLLTGKP